MSDNGFETFEVSPADDPGPSLDDEQENITQRGKTLERSEEMAESEKCLHVTIVDHTPVIEGTDDSSYIDLRIPLGMVDSGLKLVPAKKLGDIDPDMIVQMVNMGAQGQLVNINEEKKSISIRIE